MIGEFKEAKTRVVVVPEWNRLRPVSSSLNGVAASGPIIIEKQEKMHD
jgi:hypothetical protein